MKIDKDLSKEKDFLNDSVRFYETKGFRPALKDMKTNYTALRQKPDFEENDFLDSSGLQFNIAQKIYLIGKAEYKTELSFTEFLYLVFWKPDSWSRENRSSYAIRYYRYHASRFKDHVFRTKHKFQQRGVAQKEISEDENAKKIWREHSGLNKDKAKSHHRYQSSTHYDRILAHRRERRKVRTTLHSGKEVDNKTKKDMGDYWD